jgi:hypothetical protein
VFLLVHVLVDGERDGHAGVSQPLRHRLDRLAGGEQQRGVGVPQVVQPDPRQLVLPQRPARLEDLLDEPARVPLGVSVGAVAVAEYERGIADEPGREPCAGRPVGAQVGDGVHVDVDHARLAGLRGSLDELFVGTVGLHGADAAATLQPAGVEVDVPPPQGQRFAAAHPGRGQQSPAHGQVGVAVLGPAQEASQLCGRPRLHLRRSRF